MLVVESHPDAAALSGAEEAEQALREQLEKGEKSALAEAPAADWYQEEAESATPATQAPAQFKGIDELLEYLSDDPEPMTLEQAQFEQSIGLNEWDPLPEGVEYPKEIASSDR